MACVAERGQLVNRMARSTTSYLVRAARQPVGWQPWGRDAFELAARLDRPILLYVGSDDCRLCALMDREAYADPELGVLIDSLFVPVRVDRDARPDVARRYETAVQTLAGLRGLPLTVFLTPDGAAFFGGTFFPADDPVTGRGLRQILPEVARSYRERRVFVLRHAALVRELAVVRSAVGAGPLRAEVVRREIEGVRRSLLSAARGRASPGSVAHAQAIGLMLAEYRGTGDTLWLAAATAGLDLLLDSLVAPPTPPSLGREDPPQLLRAALLGPLAAAAGATGRDGYREAAGRLARQVARDLGEGGGGDTYADQAAFRIAALLETAPALGEPGLVEQARLALEALLKRMYAPGRGVRHASDGDVVRLLQDQVQVAAACLAAHRALDRLSAGGPSRFLLVAQDLAAVLDRDFADSAGGYYDSARPDPAAPALADRTKQVLDDVLPSGNASAARLLLGLADVTGDARYRQRARATLEAFAGLIGGEGVRVASYLEAAQAVLPR